MGFCGMWGCIEVCVMSAGDIERGGYDEGRRTERGAWLD